MKEWFGKVKNAKMILNNSGKIASNLFEEIPDHFENVKVDYFVIMPNHIHGIIILNVVGTGHAPSLRMRTPTLGNVVGSFKSAVTKSLRKSGHKSFQWQPRFYDHIIRNE
jgi:REP element-mobilizing transposase RayT